MTRFGRAVSSARARSSSTKCTRPASDRATSANCAARSAVANVQRRYGQTTEASSAACVGVALALDKRGGNRVERRALTPAQRLEAAAIIQEARRSPRQKMNDGVRRAYGV